MSDLGFHVGSNVIGGRLATKVLPEVQEAHAPQGMACGARPLALLKGMNARCHSRRRARRR